MQVQRSNNQQSFGTVNIKETGMNHDEIKGINRKIEELQTLSEGFLLNISKHINVQTDISEDLGNRHCINRINNSYPLSILGKLRATIDALMEKNVKSNFSIRAVFTDEPKTFMQKCLNKLGIGAKGTSNILLDNNIDEAAMTVATRAKERYSKNPIVMLRQVKAGSEQLKASSAILK